jgi:hypothetical protein
MNLFAYRRVNIKTELSMEQFEQLHADVAKARETTKMVYVDKVAMQTLLRDYSRLIDRLEKLEKEEGMN